MDARYDLVIRRGTVVDGTGSTAFIGDVAVKDGAICAIGTVRGGGTQEIDASGRLVTPGFVDIHTHYDGQVTWSSHLGSSAEHGVTTVLMGNCGVGFAPCRAAYRSQLVHLMEGIEDIPEIVMTEGLPWNWESFPEYLDRVQQRRYDIDVAFQLPHAPLRVYVMGERALMREPATSEDIAQMRHLAREAVNAGAFGFSTSRSIHHQAIDGTMTPTYTASANELEGIALGLKDANSGVLQLASDFSDIDADFDVMRRMVSASGRPLTVSLAQSHRAPEGWRRYLDEIDRAVRDGLPIKAQVANRPVGVFLGLRLARNPFMRTAGYRELEHLELPQRVERMRQPNVRARILAQMPGNMSAVDRAYMTPYADMHEFVGDYEPAADRYLGARAAALRVEPMALAYDILTANNGDAILCYIAANYADGQVHALEEMISHQHTIFGLGDAGAHLGLIFDASMPTYMIERWSNVGRGVMPIELAVKLITADTAGAVEMHDRGIIAAGYRGDLNVINPSRLSIGRHQLVGDLPAGRLRLHQSATGYEATIVAGEIIHRDGVATGALPGRLVRNGHPRPPPCRDA